METGPVGAVLFGRRSAPVSMTGTLRRVAVALLAAAIPASAAGLPAATGTPSTPADPAPDDPCASADSLAPAASLYCIELVPRPEVRGASGMARLGRGPGPFSVATTPGGRLRYRVSVTAEGLPRPDSLGDYGAYVAWAAPPGLEPMVKLGALEGGGAGPATIPFNRFLVLVTAEPSAEVETRSGPPVLRGLSPTMQMSDVHLTGLGAREEGGGGGKGAGAGGGGAGGRPAAEGDADRGGEPGDDPAARGWTRPPMNPRVTPMSLGGLRDRTPRATPYLPAWEVDPDTLPASRPRQVVEMSTGDTVRLRAGLVRHTVGDRELVMMAYDRQVPGPLIRVPEAATVYAELENRTGWPTTIHWHGVRLENRFDGVPGVTQEPVESGERFLYRIRFPDPGIYWYHPHVREDLQQDLGLYGNIRVESPDPAHYGPAHREEVLVLDDLLLGESGLVPWGREHATHAVMGRFGNVLLVNGGTSWSLDVRRGEVVRFHLTNVSNVRTFHVSFGDAPMKVVATDVGRFQREERTESVVVAPAERYVVDVRFPEAGEVALVNRVHAIDHGSDGFFSATDTLGTVDVSPEPARPDLAAAFDTLRSHPELERRLDRLRERSGAVPRKELVLSVEDRGLPFALRQAMLQEARSYVHPVEWTGTMPAMDWLPTTDRVRWVLREPDTGRENREIRWNFEVGDLVRLRIHNDRESLHPMQHPIHIHGQRFLVLAVNGEPSENLAWKDTVLVPVGATVDLLLELSNPGDWMLHCHVSEHLEAGMMFTFTVEGEADLWGPSSPSTDSGGSP